MADYFLEDRLREGDGERTAILTEGGSVTYDQVSRASNRYANGLVAQGIGRGSRVMMALPDGPDYVYALFGILKAGGQAMMVNPHLAEAQLAGFFDYVQPAAVVLHADHASTFSKAAEGADHAPPLLVVGGAFGEQCSSVSEAFDTVATDPSDPALWLFSGGTTGTPKGVVQSHASFANTTECYGKGVLGLGPDDITLSVPKLYFGYATGSGLLFPFAVGAATALFPERCTADELFRQIGLHRPTVLVNVPTMVNHLVSHPRAVEQDLSCLRLSTSAGEALPPDLHRRWNQLFGVELLDGLGTAEMWHIFISNRPEQVRPGTLGTVVPGFEVRLTDAQGEDVPTGEVGRMRVRGRSRAIGYWQMPELSERTFDGDWYISGDMMRSSEDGFYTYEGRADDLMKVSGKWLSPSEVEHCLMEHEQVKEAAVVGVETADGLTKPEAFVVLSGSGGPGIEAELQEYVKTRLEPYKYPRSVHLCEDLPRTHLGKVDRGQLKRVRTGDTP